MLVLSLKLRYHSGMKKNARLACACSLMKTRFSKYIFLSLAISPLTLTKMKLQGLNVVQPQP